MRNVRRAADRIRRASRPEAPKTNRFGEPDPDIEGVFSLRQRGGVVDTVTHLDGSACVRLAFLPDGTHYSKPCMRGAGQCDSLFGLIHPDTEGNPS